MRESPATSPSAEKRISFYEEQARRRTQARLWAGVTIAIAGLLGWVLGFLVMAGTLFYTNLLASFLPRNLEELWNRTIGSATLGLLIAAGFFFAVALWLAVRRIFGRDTSAAFLERLGAREPRSDDLEEKQLVNVVEEIAIAATAPVPRVLLFDGETINAAMLGNSPQHATLLMSRRMLNTLDRDETQGVIGHLTASAINGDLSLTAEMLRLFHVLGLAITILDLPFSARARSAFVGALGLSLGIGARDAARQTAVSARLTESLQPEGMEPLVRFMRAVMDPDGANPVRKVIGALLLMPLFPLIFIRLGAGLLYGLLSLLVLGPLVALLLRSRRRLADATAVQLTRHPDGLACALVHLAREAHAMPNAGWGEMLFIVGPEAAEARSLDRLQQRLTTIRTEAGGFRERAAALRSHTLESQAQPQTEAARHSFVFGFHPSLNSRIAQLKKMGATKVQWEVRKSYDGLILAAVIILVLGGVALIAIAGSR